MRIYIGHGEEEPGLEEVSNLAASLRDQGCSVRLVIYEDTGHGIRQPVSSELRRILDYFKAAE
jgi:predicted esterase